ncbi:MAG TPA: 7-cyano-7-deazaguanine synthase [Methanobacterium sp.]|nr:7-cyano-7-deazaguanine synthase [Methanobacterium sp.]
MKACVLYSGGKDSSLIAVVLKNLGYEVELVTVNFGIYPSWKSAAKSSSNLLFKHRILNAELDVLKSAVDTIIKDGFPNNGINQVHKYALELAAKDYPLVADGTRRDDRVPKLDLNEVRSFEDRNNVEYINLGGFGHKSINHLSKTLFEVKKELSSMENNSDYEIEIRYLISELEGDELAFKIFPEHLQSRVIGWRENE